MFTVVGIDLSAKERNPTGICILKDKPLCFTVYRDIEILKIIKEYSPVIISIDSPLSLEVPYRNSEKLLYQLGFRPLPLSIESMKLLYRRAISIVNKLGNIKVIETYPRATEKILGFSYEKFSRYFKNKHEYDAWLCAIVGKLYLWKKVRNLDGIYIPL